MFLLLCNKLNFNDNKHLSSIVLGFSLRLQMDVDEFENHLSILCEVYVLGGLC